MTWGLCSCFREKAEGEGGGQGREKGIGKRHNERDRMYCRQMEKEQAKAEKSGRGEGKMSGIG